MRIADTLRSLLPGTPIREDASGRTLTTFGVGGPIAALVEPRSVAELSSVLKTLFRHSLPWRVLGNGSNLVLPDTGLNEVVLRFGKESQRMSMVAEDQLDVTEDVVDLDRLAPLTSDRLHELDGGLLYVSAAVPLMTLSRTTAQAGLSGLEFAAGIPAAVGGAVFMNAGAHGGTLSEVVHSAVIMTENGELRWLTAAELCFSYRHTQLPSRSVVIGAFLKLRTGSSEEIQERRSHNLEYRKRTQPLTLPSAGSVFRNPRPDLAAAQLLEELKLKGYGIGGAAYSELHSNWIVRLQDTARADDIRELVDIGQERVFQAFQLELVPEIMFW